MGPMDVIGVFLDTPSQFSRLISPIAGLQDTFSFLPLRRYLRRDGIRWWHARDHMQTVQRIPGQNDNWFLMTRSSRVNGNGRLYFIEFPRIESGLGHPLNRTPRTSNRTGNYFTTRVTGGHHPGGSQALGNLIATSTECSGECRSHVDFYHFRGYNDVERVSQLRLDNGHDELTCQEGENRISKTSAVGAIRLANGKALIIVGGQRHSSDGWFFISSDEKLTDWDLVNYFHGRNDFEQWGEWENLNLFPDCNGEDIYLIAQGMRRNKLSLYKLQVGANDEIELEYINSGRTRVGFFHSLRLGSGIHTTSNGQLILYSTSRHGQFIREYYAP